MWRAQGGGYGEFFEGVLCPSRRTEIEDRSASLSREGNDDNNRENYQSGQQQGEAVAGACGVGLKRKCPALCNKRNADTVHEGRCATYLHDPRGRRDSRNEEKKIANPLLVVVAAVALIFPIMVFGVCLHCRFLFFSPEVILKRPAVSGCFPLYLPNVMGTTFYILLFL